MNTSCEEKTNVIFSQNTDCYKEKRNNGMDKINENREASVSPILNDNLQLIFDGHCNVINVVDNEYISEENYKFVDGNELTDKSVLQNSRATITDLLTIANTQDHQIEDDLDLFQYDDVETVRNLEQSFRDINDLNFSISPPELKDSDFLDDSNCSK